MNRPLLITDCDEVLLHMVAHFQDWLREAHTIDFAFESGEFASALTHDDGAPVAEHRVWPLLEQFFMEANARQTLVPGALEALGRIGEIADIVILTNIGESGHAMRVEQLDRYGIGHEVICNSGGKGIPARALVERHKASVAAFVDDLAVHHASVAKYAPEIWRLHMVAEPRLAPAVPPAADAHVRIDDWASASDWLIARLQGDTP